MYTRDMPLCCTATVVCDFPLDLELRAQTLFDVEKYINTRMAAHKVGGDAILVATLTTQQEKVKQLLVNLGWECAGPYKKRRHKERDLYLLHYALCKPKEVKVQPRDAQGRFIKSNPFK